jgi:hypothetical protein
MTDCLNTISKNLCQNPECRHVEQSLSVAMAYSAGPRCHSMCEHCGAVLSKSIDLRPRKKKMSLPKLKLPTFKIPTPASHEGFGWTLRLMP